MLSNPGCCPGLGASALSGRLGKSLREIMASRRICNPPSKNVRPIKPGGFVIPQQKEKHTPLLRISNPQSLKRLGHFLAPDFKSGGTPSFAAERTEASFWQHALKGQKLLAQGSALGNLMAQTRRPVRAKALKYLAIYKAFALTGRLC